MVTESPAELDDWTVKKQKILKSCMLRYATYSTCTYLYHTFMSGDMIKKLFFNQIHMQISAPLVKENLSTICPVWIWVFLTNLVC